MNLDYWDQLAVRSAFLGICFTLSLEHYKPMQLPGVVAIKVITTLIRNSKFGALTTNMSKLPERKEKSIGDSCLVSLSYSK